MIYISSASLYGASNAELYTEEDPVNPKEGYLLAKYKAELLTINSLFKKAVILRVNAPYGPKQRTRTVLQIFIENALGGLDLLYNGLGSREQAFLAA